MGRLLCVRQAHDEAQDARGITDVAVKHLSTGSTTSLTAVSKVGVRDPTPICGWEEKKIV